MRRRSSTCRRSRRSRTTSTAISKRRSPASAQQLRRAGLPEVDIRTWVRTGDTPPAERERMRRRPPHILVTTPESLYVLLGSESGRSDAGDHTLGDRRRNPCDRAEQARCSSRPLARAPRGPLRRPPAAHRPVGDAEPDRCGRRLPGRRRVGRQARGRGCDHRRGPSAPARARPSRFPGRRSRR